MKWTLGEEVREIESWFSSFHSNIVPLLRLVSHAETPDREFKQSMGQFNADMIREAIERRNQQLSATVQ